MSGSHGTVTVKPLRVQSVRKDMLHLALQRNLKPFVRCYESELATAPQTGGTISLKLMLDNKNSVESISSTAQGYSVVLEPIADCISTRLQKTSFPRTSPRGLASLELYVTLKPIKKEAALSERAWPTVEGDAGSTRIAHEPTWIGPITISGAEGAVRHTVSTVSDCWDTYPTKPGELTIKISLNPDGTVLQARARNGSMVRHPLDPPSKLSKCIESKIEAHLFNYHAGPHDLVLLTIPLQLESK